MRVVTRIEMRDFHLVRCSRGPGPDERLGESRMGGVANPIRVRIAWILGVLRRRLAAARDEPLTDGFLVTDNPALRKIWLGEFGAQAPRDAKILRQQRMAQIPGAEARLGVRRQNLPDAGGRRALPRAGANAMKQRFGRKPYSGLAEREGAFGKAGPRLDQYPRTSRQAAHPTLPID